MTAHRRSVSLSIAAHDALLQAAAARGITCAELVTQALRAFGVLVPEQRHRPREQAEHAAAERQRPRVATPKPLPLRRGPARGIPRAERATPRIPSAADLAALRAECWRGVSRGGLADSHEAAKRRVSIRFAHELRKRGWLAEEGYAEGSWADPKNQKRSA